MGNKRKPPTAQAGSSSSKKKKFSKGPKGKPQPSKQQDVPLPPASDEDEGQGLDVGEEDLHFVQQYGSQLGFLRDLDAQQLDKAVKDKQKAAAAAATAATADAGDEAEAGAGSDEEGAAEYERKPRAAEQQLTAAKVQVEGVQVEDTLQSEKAQRAAEKEAAAAQAAERRAAAAAEKQASAQAAAAAEAAAKKGLPSEAGLPPALLSLMSLQDSQQRREALKQQMALAAQHLLAEPDRHVGPGLRLLLGCAGDRDGTVVRLALLSLLAVFKDLLPGYRIRSLTEEEQEVGGLSVSAAGTELPVVAVAAVGVGVADLLQHRVRGLTEDKQEMANHLLILLLPLLLALMRVSKEVQALRDYEQALLKGYQAYLKALLALRPPSQPPRRQPQASAAAAAAAAACLPRGAWPDLLQALVPLMLGPDAQVAAAACDAVRQLLQEDVQGTSSLEAVQLVADLVKTRKCSVPPAVVSCLLVLRFEQVTPVSAGGEGAGGGKAKKLGKKAARRAKRKTDLDKEFEEAEAGPDLAQLALLQSQMLEALFEVFFRVLKHCSTATSHHAATATAGTAAAAAASAPAEDDSGSKGVLQQPWPASKVHRKFPLLQPALEGLGRYSHLISVEYFNDLMAVLQDLLAAGALPLRERLGVLLAALDILKGQGEALTIDRRAFYNQLYQALLLVPLQLLHEAGDIPAKFAGKLAGKFAGKNGAAANGAADKTSSAEQQQQQQQQQQKGTAGSASSSVSRDVAPTAVLLLRCLEQQLLGVKQTDMGRLAAYAKRLAQLMLSSSTPEALGCACLLYRLMRRHPKLTCLFEWEGGAPVGGRQFDADCSDPSEAGALAAALWELPLLAQHYHPHVAAAARMLLTLTPGSGSGAGGNAAAGGDGAAAAGASGSAAGAAVIAGASGPQEVAAVYGAVRLGGFRPAPPMPAAAGGRGKGRVNGAVAGSSKAGMAARQAASGRPWCEDLQQAVAAAADPDQQQQQQQQQVRQHGKRKPQLQQQLQQQQMAVVAAAVGAADAVDVHSVEQALQEQYRLSKLYRRNSELRRELAMSAKKVEMFREHLIQKRQQEEQQQLLQPLKKKHRKHA
ncbi:CBF/Mak21 family-domain-containing protein [Scenedesmus sp. NREL 46B-D3]|nr:CBF/Mak21 family-domain-containing protein [Scenedesmus sp. NREL 46B-D3]